MKSTSDHYPELTVQSNDKTQVRYNVTEATKTEMDGSKKTVYDFDYVEIEGEVTKEKIIEAILLSTQPKESEKPVEPEPVIEEEPIDAQMVVGAISEAYAIVKQGSEAISEVLKPKKEKDAK